MHTITKWALVLSAASTIGCSADQRRTKAPTTDQATAPADDAPELEALVSSTVTIIALKEALHGEETVSAESQGSGFVSLSNGKRVVVTALHVVDGANEIVLLHPSGMRSRATAVLAYDRKADVAVLEVDRLPKEARPLKGGGSVPKIGSEVVIVGSPLGLDQTLAFGTVAAHRKEWRAFQLAAGVSPGSSGGLVCDRDGTALGVVRAKAPRQSGGENIAYVTPMRFVEKSLKKGKRKALPQAPHADRMVEISRNPVRTEKAEGFWRYKAVANLELESGSRLRDHVCVDSGDPNVTVVLSEVVPDHVEPDFRMGRGRSCATFAPNTKYVASAFTKRAGQRVTLTLQRQK